jgi:hemolysin-activating ACP:hemolysin acyltransferase
MDAITTNRKRLGKQQTELRRLLTDPDQFESAMKLFFEQHASLHSAKVSDLGVWSYEDALLDDLSGEQFRRIPNHCEHSIAWCIWHLARIEDTAMNILIADSPQVFHEGAWQAKTNIAFIDCGNEMDAAATEHLSEQINLQALRAYRLAVGRRTQEIVAALRPDDLKQKVNPNRIQRVMDEGAITAASQGIADYWSKRDFAGLLLMPASRHILVHLNEMLALKKRKEGIGDK